MVCMMLPYIIQAEILTAILIWRSHKDRQINLHHYQSIYTSIHTIILKTANLNSCQRFLNKPPNKMVANNSAYTVYTAKHLRERSFIQSRIFSHKLCPCQLAITISLQACYHASFPANNHFHSKIQVSPLNVLLHRANF